MGKKYRNGPMYVDRQLIRSRPWLELTSAAPQVYLLFRARAQVAKVKRGNMKRNPWKVINNGEIQFPYIDAARDFGISSKRFARALSQLVEKGFLDIEHHGGGCEGDATRYALSERWRAYGTADFKPSERPKGRKWVIPKTKPTDE